MILQALHDRVLLKPIFTRQKYAEELKQRSGLYLPEADNKYSFEGVPNQGHIVSLPEDYEGDLQIGDHVVFSDKKPNGTKFGEDKFIDVGIKDIVARIL